MYFFTAKKNLTFFFHTTHETQPGKPHTKRATTKYKIRGELGVLPYVDPSYWDWSYMRDKCHLSHASSLPVDKVQCDLSIAY